MLKHRHIETICCVVTALTLLTAILFSACAALGYMQGDGEIGYESRLFDTARVHTIDLVMEDWASFLKTCTSEEYTSCTAVIDGEAYGGVGIRGKGNTSLSSVQSYGNDRYSFKVEFDQYQAGKSYYGLDKLSLNNLISDNTYMKDYLCYTMMRDMGVAAPLCSFVYITVNGEDWGLYLAVEGVEDSFLQRNYGGEQGELYKPDSMDMGGGRGAGKEFDMEGLWEAGGEMPAPPERPEGMGDPGAWMAASDGIMPSDGGMGAFGGGPGGFGGMGGGDVMLQYSDDDPESYANIFDNAKTDVTAADKTRLIGALKRLGEGDTSAVDVEAVIRYFVVHTFVCNEDSYTGSLVHNYYLYEQDGVLSMIPWDYNLAFGGMSTSGMGGGESADAASIINAPIDTPVRGGDMDSRPMLAWIFQSEAYTARYHELYAAWMERYFQSGSFDEMLTQTEDLIAPYVQKDPTAFCTYEEFLAGVETLRTFCTLRAESVSAQLNGTIPATTAGQAADSASLIDAEGLSLETMGKFQNGGGMPNDENRPGMGGRTGSDGRMGGPSGMPMGARADSSGIPMGFPGGAPGDRGGPGASAGGTQASAWLWLGGCALALGGGIFLARRAKRHA